MGGCNVTSEAWRGLTPDEHLSVQKRILSLHYFWYCSDAARPVLALISGRRAATVADHHHLSASNGEG